MKIEKYKEVCDFCKYVENGKDRCLYCIDNFWQFGIHSEFQCVESLSNVKLTGEKNE